MEESASNVADTVSEMMNVTPKGRRGRPPAETITTLMVEGSMSGDSRLMCNYCTRIFPREKSLHAHERTHTGQKPYKCSFPSPLCNKEFVQSGQLKTHMRTHTNECCFKCPVEGCNSRFRHSNRHCVAHPKKTLIRSPDPDFPQKMLGDKIPPEVREWAYENYVKTRERRATTKRRAATSSHTGGSQHMNSASCRPSQNGNKCNEDEASGDVNNGHRYNSVSDTAAENDRSGDVHEKTESVSVQRRNVLSEERRMDASSGAHGRPDLPSDAQLSTIAELEPIDCNNTLSENGYHSMMLDSTYQSTLASQTIDSNLDSSSFCMSDTANLTDPFACNITVAHNGSSNENSSVLSTPQRNNTMRSSSDFVTSPISRGDYPSCSTNTTNSFYATPKNQPTLYSSALDSRCFLQQSEDSSYRTPSCDTRSAETTLFSTPLGNELKFSSLGTDYTSTPLPRNEAGVYTPPAGKISVALPHSNGGGSGRKVLIPNKRVKSRRGLGNLMEAASCSNSKVQTAAVQSNAASSNNLMPLSSPSITSSITDENAYGQNENAPKNVPSSPRHSRVFKNTQNLQQPPRKTETFRCLDIDGIKPLNSDEPFSSDSYRPCLYANPKRAEYLGNASHSLPSFTTHPHPAKVAMEMTASFASTADHYRGSAQEERTPISSAAREIFPRDSFDSPSHPRRPHSALRASLLGERRYSHTPPSNCKKLYLSPAAGAAAPVSCDSKKEQELLLPVVRTSHVPDEQSPRTFKKSEPYHNTFKPSESNGELDCFKSTVFYTERFNSHPQYSRYTDQVNISQPCSSQSGQLVSVSRLSNREVDSFNYTSSAVEGDAAPYSNSKSCFKATYLNHEVKSSRDPHETECSTSLNSDNSSHYYNVTCSRKQQLFHQRDNRFNNDSMTLVAAEYPAAEAIHIPHHPESYMGVESPHIKGQSCTDVAPPEASTNTSTDSCCSSVSTGGDGDHIEQKYIPIATTYSATTPICTAAAVIPISTATSIPVAPFFPKTPTKRAATSALRNYSPRKMNPKKRWMSQLKSQATVDVPVQLVSSLDCHVNDSAHSLPSAVVTIKKELTISEDQPLNLSTRDN